MPQIGKRFEFMHLSLQQRRQAFDEFMEHHKEEALQYMRLGRGLRYLSTRFGVPETMMSYYYERHPELHVTEKERAQAQREYNKDLRFCTNDDKTFSFVVFPDWQSAGKVEAQAHGVELARIVADAPADAPYLAAFAPAPMFAEVAPFLIGPQPRYFLYYGELAYMRYLLAEKFDPDFIMQRMGISRTVFAHHLAKLKQRGTDEAKAMRAVLKRVPTVEQLGIKRVIDSAVPRKTKLSFYIRKP